jgi:glycosyltransferase involved in cell wall biosynthesis
MRILMVHQAFGDQGGAEANVRQVGRALREHGHEVRLLFGDETGRGHERFEKSFSAIRSWRSGSSEETRAWAMDPRPDVLFVHKLSDVSVLRTLSELGVPRVRMVHDHDMYCQQSSRYFPWNRKICHRPAGYICGLYCGVVRSRGTLFPVKLLWPGKKLAELDLARAFELTLVNSDFMRGELLLNAFPDDRIRVVHPPVAPVRTGFVPEYSETAVVFVGQLIRGKGVDKLIEALGLCENRSIRAWIVGDGSHRAYCEELSRKLGLQSRVTFTGFVDPDALDQFLSRARLGVMPSMWPEPYGMAGVELMAHGLGVVAFDSGGTSEWLAHGAVGELVETGDVAGLAAAIDRLVVDEQKCRELGAAARERAGWLSNPDGYVHEIESILSSVAVAGALP